ncbi:MAG TPA: hypothetical protein VNT79_03795 [Phycisphaerae bacterium]|nr:hypothetical protein [Phycisphaerae bacterium]
MIREKTTRAAKSPSRWSAWVIGIGCIGLVSIVARGDAQPIPIVLISPNDVYQAAIGALESAPDRMSFEERLAGLLMLCDGHLKTAIEQLALYAARQENNPRARAMVGNILKRLDVSRHQMVAALAPHLDNQASAVVEVARELMRESEDRSAERPPDFSAYRALIEADVRAGRDPQASLIAFMFESEPGAALLTLVRAYQLRDPDEIKPILWAEHVVADLLWRRRFGFVERRAVDPAVIRELEKLSRHPFWWVRLYVARVVDACPELAGPGLVNRLSADPNVLVRRVPHGPESGE